jgi:hypothetical protein
MRIKKELTPDQLRLKELEKILKRDKKRFLSFIEALGEIGSKQLHQSSYQRLEEYIYYKCNLPFYLTKDIKNSAIDYFEILINTPVEKTRRYRERSIGH